jgi:predicted phosphoribosyltransferase
MRFRDRTHAGRELASALEDRKGEDGLLVLALPRGGAPVACEVAEALDAPLDVFLVRKLGVPGREELAFGAIASGGARVLNDDVVRALGISDATIDQVGAGVHSGFSTGCWTLRTKPAGAVAPHPRPPRRARSSGLPSERG